MHEIPDNHYLVCVVGKVTLKQWLKNFIESMVMQWITLRFTEYWVLIFDQKKLSYALNTGNNFEGTIGYFEDCCQNLKKLPAAKLKELYFYEPPEVLEERHKKLLNLECIKDCLIPIS